MKKIRTKYVDDAVAGVIAQNMPAYTRGVWILCCETGVRISDAVGALASDFDDRGRYHYIAHKTGKKGTAQCSKNFIKMYVPKKGLLFPSPVLPGKPVTRQTVFNHVKKACERAHIASEGIAPHSARKNFAVNAFHNGGLGFAMKNLQHADVGTTLIYALSDDVVSDILRRLGRVERHLAKITKGLEMLSDWAWGDDCYIPADMSDAEAAKLSTHLSTGQ